MFRSDEIPFDHNFLNALTNFPMSIKIALKPVQKLQKMTEMNIWFKLTFIWVWSERKKAMLLMPCLQAFNTEKACQTSSNFTFGNTQKTQIYLWTLFFRRRVKETTICEIPREQRNKHHFHIFFRSSRIRDKKWSREKKLIPCKIHGMRKKSLPQSQVQNFAPPCVQKGTNFFIPTWRLLAGPNLIPNFFVMCAAPKDQIQRWVVYLPIYELRV